jgi:hypothetical protein
MSPADTQIVRRKFESRSTLCIVCDHIWPRGARLLVGRRRCSTAMTCIQQHKTLYEPAAIQGGHQETQWLPILDFQIRMWCSVDSRLGVVHT